ncbi:MarR family winged helix-turn-helix transcriptional regulator [Sphaerisporangium perillae]|uniref:MarR family winged helix-turn-helix transcriptional regulator n=1 Tax=Sphaerisporangium perillae TaxID=2935860 RepID=UPI00200C056F|nr:MarR family winged helix-turn-helix transcriptional regulator [Sphaerisporangium perillae]
MTVQQPPASARTPDLDVWRSYTTVHAQLASHLARELTRATGLSEADYQILDALLDAPGARMRALELRWALQWEKSRLSHQVARMSARGLLERVACTEDARGWDISLTVAGREAAVRARQVREESVRGFVLETLGTDRMAHLAEVAALLSDRLARAAEEDPACRAERAAAYPDEAARTR